MLSFINESLSVWERLLQTRKPIVLYGMGNGADKVLDEFNKRNIKSIYGLSFPFT